MQKTGAGVAYRGDAAQPASDLERYTDYNNDKRSKTF
jgi:hypothetical protein